MADLKKEYEGVLCDIEYLIERTEAPLYNQLESGFRHTPLTSREIKERYETCCKEVHGILSFNLPRLRAMYEDWCKYDDLRKS